MRTLCRLWWVTLLPSAVAVDAQNITSGKLLLSDDFTRPAADTADLGKLPTGGQAWGKRVPLNAGVPSEGAIRSAQGVLQIGYNSAAGPFDTGGPVAGFAVADAAISLTVGPSYIDGRCNNAIINYRAQTTDAAAGGRQPGAYHVELAGDWPGSRDLLLRYGRDVLATGDMADKRVPGDSHKVRLAFAGDRHTVWVDDRKVIDYWEIEAGRKQAGGVGFGAWYSIAGFDDFTLSEAANPGKPPANAGGMGPLVFQGRPFFVVGTYNPPDDEDLQEWLVAGCNTAVLNAPATDPSVAAANAQVA